MELNGATLPISSRETVPYTPESRCDGEGKPLPGAPVYLVKVASLIERAQWRRDVAALGARYPGNDEIYRALRQAVAAAGPGNEAALLEALDRLEAAGAVAEDDPDLALANRAADVLRPVCPPLAELFAQRAFWAEVAPLQAARRFLRGWSVDGAERELPQSLGLIREDALARLPPGHADAVGWKAISLMRPTEAQEKNSASPSGSATSPRPTGAASDPRTADRAGKSRAKSTP
jgi:hypothetical protein